MKDYCEIVGISPDRKEEEIRRSYRKLAMQYHPDRNMRQLGVEPAEIDIVVLSHFHGDHTGWLGGSLEKDPPVTAVEKEHEASSVMNSIQTTWKAAWGKKSDCRTLNRVSVYLLITGGPAGLDGSVIGSIGGGLVDIMAEPRTLDRYDMARR